MKKRFRVGDKDGLVAENEIMGICALSPRLMTNLAWFDVWGSITAWTSSLFGSSKAAKHGNDS
jgi:hypothetical protein